jgi:serine/threonine-protein kinase
MGSEQPGDRTWIDEVADRFERAWGDGPRPRIEDYLADVAEPRRTRLLGELLRVERQLALEAGEHPAPSEYRRRFPAHLAVVETVFASDRTATAGPAERTGDQADRGLLLGRRAPQDRPPGPTAAPPSQDGLRGDDVGRIRLARNAAAEARATEVVRDLLRRRLRLAFLLVTVVFWPAGCLGIVNAALNAGMITPRVWLAIAFFAGPFVAFVALTVLLWSRRPLSLARLRATELALIGLLAMACVLKQRSYLDAAPELVRRYGDRGPTLLAGYHGLFWFALLATYGLFVPNSWRRCAVFVALIAACPFVIALAGRADLPLADRPFLFYLTTLGFWAVFGALLAAFGSHHIEALRKEAGEARELGPYRLTRRLGAGGMGEVYQAEHRLLRRPCAVKLIRPERFADPRYLGLFEREVQATAALTHPNTVEVYDYGHAEDGTFYYVMEYLSGLTLEDLVGRHGPLPPGRAVYLLRQVCDALREAHAAGLVHRDVKPGNVMVCTRGGIHDVAKLLDFGLVERRGPGDPGDDPAWQGGVAGTPAYMAPEQATGRGRPDARSDLYSLGAVGFFILTGQPPFVRGSVLRVLAAHEGDPVSFPDPIDGRPPDDLQAVVLRCLEKDPADRFADATNLEAALAACQCSGSWTREEAARWWGSMVGG